MPYLVCYCPRSGANGFTGVAPVELESLPLIICDFRTLSLFLPMHVGNDLSFRLSHASASCLRYCFAFLLLFRRQPIDVGSQRVSLVDVR